MVMVDVYVEGFSERIILLYAACPRVGESVLLDVPDEEGNEQRCIVYDVIHRPRMQYNPDIMLFVRRIK